MSANPQKSGKTATKKTEVAAPPSEEKAEVVEAVPMSPADQRAMSAFAETRVSAMSVLATLKEVPEAVGVKLAEMLPQILDQQRERDAQAVLQDRLRLLQQKAKGVPMNGVVKKDFKKPDGPTNVKYKYPLWVDVRKAVLPMLAELGLALKPLEIIKVQPLLEGEARPDKAMKNFLLGYATYRLTVCAGGAEMKFDSVFPLSVSLNADGVPVIDLNLAARACEGGARRRMIMSMAMLSEPDPEDLQNDTPSAQARKATADFFRLAYEEKFGKKFDQAEDKAAADNVIMNVAILFGACAVPVNPDEATKGESKVCFHAFKEVVFATCKDEAGAAVFLEQLTNPPDDNIKRINPKVENCDAWRAAFNPLEIPCWKV